MAKLHEVDPENFVDFIAQIPANGRGAWTRFGIDFDYRYALSTDVGMRIGTRADRSLAHWAVAAGAFAIQTRLVQLKHMAPLLDSERGIFGPRTREAVISFQRVSTDPKGGALLDDDGTVGMSDARALFTPFLVRAERLYNIPDRLLVGETNHESALDPGAVGYYIYYPEYRGVDRGMSQINSRYNEAVTWLQAFDPSFAIDWSGRRLRSFYDLYQAKYPKATTPTLWDAAVCAHNNPSAAAKWAATGAAPTEAAASYVAAVKTATY